VKNLGEGVDLFPGNRYSLTLATAEEAGDAEDTGNDNSSKSDEELRSEAGG